MTRTSTIGRQIEFLTSVEEDGVPIDLIEMAAQSSPADVCAALLQAKKANRVSEVRPGIFRGQTGAGRPTLPRRDLQSLGGKLRRAIQAQPPPAQALALGRLLLNLEGDVSSAALGVIAELVEETRRHAPDATRVFLDEVLKRPEMGEFPRQRCRLALAYVGTLSSDDSPSVWRAAFEECFLAAIEANDPNGTLATLQGRVNTLLETGARREAEAELRHALMLLEHLPEARLSIQTQIARLWAYQGELDESRSLLEDVLAESEALQIATPLADSTLNGVLATQLDPSARDRLKQQFNDAVGQDDHGEASISAALGAGLAFIHGAGGEARLMARDAALHGTRIGRHWRDAERALIEASFAFVSGETERFEAEVPAAIELARGARNYPAVRSLLSLRLRWEILTLDRAAVEQTIAAIQSVAAELQPAHSVGISGLEAVSDLALGRRPRLVPGLIKAATYPGLGGLLAGMEVLATGGARASAMTMAAWGDEALAKGILTAPDWSAHLDRIVPLVLLRLGKQNRVPERLAKAAELADALDHPIEAAIARLQYAEVAEALGIRTQGEAPTATRARAVEDLLRFGIVPEPLALIAAQAVLRGSSSRRTTDLSKGQAEVLRMLGEGLTYKETATQLGLSWRTVQTQAKYAYAKLGAHDRADAVAKARRRGEI